MCCVLRAAASAWLRIVMLKWPGGYSGALIASANVGICIGASA